VARKRTKGKYHSTPGGLIRKVAYLEPEAAAELRELAHRIERPESDLIREAVRDFLRKAREGKE
jgi:hypothetical protein